MFDGLTVNEWRVLGGGVWLVAIGFVMSHYGRVGVASLGASMVMAGGGIAFAVLLVGAL